MLRAEVRHLPLQRVSAPPSAIRAFLEEHRQELLGVMAAAGGAGLRLSRRHAAIMDSLLVQLFQGALACTPGASSNVVLGAVGGYGRQLLAWKSDLDIRFITVGSTKALGKQVDAVLYPLWDAGMSIGHQVVSVADVVEAARHDLPTATALLDLRVLAGDARIAAALSERAYATLFSEARLPKFLDRLEAQTEARQQRYGDSVYLLEPDVKSGRGGLRDIDCALWAARARFRTSDLKELEKLDLLSARQVEQVSAAADFLWAIRNHLHARAARRSDRLTFAEQEALAPRLGYGVAARPGVSEVQRIGVAVEEMMSDYYRHARNIARVREQLIGRARRREPKRFSRSVVLGPGLVKSEGGVALRDPADLARNPVIALRLYATAVEHDLPVLSRTRDAIAHAASEPAFGEALRGNAEASSAFISLVACSRSARFRNGSILGELHEVGLLLAMIPEFTPVVGRVHHDMYHVYTVDVHS
ncbi:MAG TPA: [protein-PII] uridylyltransferase, partial [Polyangiales bacterium]|nr:[protein-PII] uridylyltransferase [Polyangiales bacterium]